jgi:transcriptional regulator with XRE-family HTH domain
MNEAELLKTYRVFRGMTQKEVADKLNMTHSGYSKYERGERKITIDIWVQLMTILNIPSSAIGNNEKFIVESYEMDYELRLYDLSKDILAKKGKMSQTEKESAAKLFKDQFDRIQNEKKILIDNIKFDDFDETIKWLKLEFLFKN